ncbi:MAG: hypothetical protein FJX80_05970 [Bacteroidetes bacterium]|nr:hypothetical protein [Bacteroidota bacterium]
MALDLNKSNDGATPSSGKQGGGLNLKKSDDASGSKFNLSKGETGTATGGDSSTNSDSDSSKGKGPWMWVLLIIAVLGVGVYFFAGSSSNSGGDTSGVATTETTGQAADAIGTTTGDSSNQMPSPSDGNTALPSAGDNTSGIEAQGPGSTASQTGNTAVVDSPAPVTGIVTDDKNTNPPQLEGTLEEKARLVIKGAFGNGAERRSALGSQYDEIQAKVNELLSSN